MKPSTHLARAVAILTMTAGGVGCASSAPGSAAATAPDRAPRLYVTNQEAATVSVISLATHDVVATVDLQQLGFTANAKPHHVVVEPDGSYWYVSLIADGFVLKFDRDNHLVASAPFETPGLLALHPTRDLLYVGRSMAAVSPPQRIGEIRRSDMSIEELDVFFDRPHAIAIDPTRDLVFSGSLAGNDIATMPIDNPAPRLVSLPGDPHVFVQFAVSPDGRELVSTGQLTGMLLVFNLSGGFPELIRTVDVGRSPWHPVYTPDGRYVYFGNQGSNSVMAVDTRTWTVAHEITGPGLAEPHGIAVSPDGRYVYVSNRNLKGEYHAPGTDPRVGNVVVINTATNRIDKVIPVGRYAAGLGIG